MLQPQNARHLLDSIPTETIVGLQDRALIVLRQYTFARIVAAVAVDTDDIFVNGRRCFVRLREKGGRQHEMPLHNIAEETVLFAAFFLHGREMSRWALIVANRNFCFASADCVSKPRSAAEMMN